MKALVLNGNTMVLEDGTVKDDCHSRPNKPAPDGLYNSPDYCWHDILRKWVPTEEWDKPFYTER